MDWHKRITQARTAKNLNKSELAALVGVTPATITMWESGQTKKIEGANLIKVCAALDINPTWLLGKLTHEESNNTGLGTAVSKMSSLMYQTLTYQIDIVQFHADGQIVEVEPVFEKNRPRQTAVRREWVERRGFDWKSLVAVRISESSMEPTLHIGDIAVVNRADVELADGGVFVVSYENSVVIRRMVRDASQWWLVADHNDQRRHSRKTLTEDSRVLGRIVLVETEQI